jgi:hypothetical protein
MNKQDYLRSVRVLCDPVVYFEYDEVQLATMAQKVAGYRFKKSAQVFTILATLCTAFFIVMTWVIQQNTMGIGLELFIVFSSIFACFCVMIEPARELFHRGEAWDRAETHLNQVLWQTRPNAKYNK